MNLVGGYDGLAKRLIDIVHLKKTRVTQSDFQQIKKNLKLKDKKNREADNEISDAIKVVDTKLINEVSYLRTNLEWEGLPFLNS